MKIPTYTKIIRTPKDLKNLQYALDSVKYMVDHPDEAPVSLLDNPHLQPNPVYLAESGAEEKIVRDFLIEDDQLTLRLETSPFTEITRITGNILVRDTNDITTQIRSIPTSMTQRMIIEQSLAGSLRKSITQGRIFPADADALTQVLTWLSLGHYSKKAWKGLIDTGD